MNARSAGVLFALVASVTAAPRAQRASPMTSVARSAGTSHHYTIGARIRPLLFWIGKDDVGDAVVAAKHEAGSAAFSVLVGTDPDRAPRRINRWGYISEEIRGSDATIVGLMTESDEESVVEAEANLQRQKGERTFNVIRTSVAEGEAHSIVTSLAAPAEYTFRQVDMLLNMADSRSRDGRTRVVQLPGGTRPGLLVSLADIVHEQAAMWQSTHTVSPAAAITYVYHGKLYQLRTVRSHPVTNLRIGGALYEHAIASQFQIKNQRDGASTAFSITFVADGPLAETVVTASYQPRWWIEIQLTLDDTKQAPAPVFATGGNP
jgi:hypothetical protein